RAAGTSSGVRNKSRSLVARQIPVWTCSANAPETTYGTRQRFNSMRVSRNIASCFGGNFGRSEELTGSLADGGMAALDGKATWDVAATPPGVRTCDGQFWGMSGLTTKSPYRFFRD